MKEYKCTPGIGPRTVAYFLSVIGVFFIIACFGTKDMPDGSVFVFVFILFAARCGYNYMMMPTAVIADRNSITIKCPLNSSTINFSDITSISNNNNFKLRFSGFGFGSYDLATKDGSLLGKYERGSIKFYCTQGKNIILIETRNNKIVITPDDANDFMQEITLHHPSLVKHNSN